MSEAITEVNRDTFWTLIDQAKEHLDDPNGWLKERLTALGAGQAKKFDDIASAYISLSHRYGLRAAASVMDQDGHSGACFIKFQEWLVCQGKAVYMAALKDPDSLADAPDYRGTYPFTCLIHSGKNVYWKLTGRSVSQDRDPAGYRALKMELARDIVYGGGIDCLRDRADAPAYLPRVCAKYLAPVDIKALAQSRGRARSLTDLRQAVQESAKAAGTGGDEYTLKLYAALHVDVTESSPGCESCTWLPDPDLWASWPDPECLKAYHRAILDAITADPPTKDMTAVFQSDFRGLPALQGLAAKVSSMVQTVEDVGGKFFSVTACRVKGRLDAAEIVMLKEYCRALHDEDPDVKELCCPASEHHGHLEVEIRWEKDCFMFTRQEMERPPLAQTQRKIEGRRRPMSDGIAEVNKDTFWALIGQAREHSEGPNDWLMDLGPEQAKRFDDIASGYSGLAYRYGLWTAASVMERGYCSDDGFIDFRNWLVSQGKAVYMAALADPDSLADGPEYREYQSFPLAYTGSCAYEELTGQDVVQEHDPARYMVLVEELRRDIVYGEGIDYPYDQADIPAYVPRLCAKYLTPEQVRKLAQARGCTWNLTSAEIRLARQGPKSSRVTGKSTRKKGGEAR